MWPVALKDAERPAGAHSARPVPRAGQPQGDQAFSPQSQPCPGSSLESNRQAVAARIPPPPTPRCKSQGGMVLICAPTPPRCHAQVLISR